MQAQIEAGRIAGRHRHAGVGRGGVRRSRDVGRSREQGCVRAGPPGGAVRAAPPGGRRRTRAGLPCRHGIEAEERGVGSARSASPSSRSSARSAPPTTSPSARAIDALAVVLRARSARWRSPCATAGRSSPSPSPIGAADVYVGLGLPVRADLRQRRGRALRRRPGRAPPVDVGAGGGRLRRLRRRLRSSTPRADGDRGALHLALVAGWLVVVLAVSEVVRIRRDQAAERARAERGRAPAPGRRAAPAPRPGAARRAGPQHLAHQRAGQRGPAPHRRAARAGPPGARRHQGGQPRRAPRAAHARSTSCAAARTRPAAPAPRWPTSTALVAGVRASGLDVRLERRRRRRRRCRRPSSWPPTGSCRRRSPTSPATPRARVGRRCALALRRRRDRRGRRRRRRRRRRRAGQRHRRDARAGGRARRHGRGRARRRAAASASRPTCRSGGAA